MIARYRNKISVPGALDLVERALDFRVAGDDGCLFLLKSHGSLVEALDSLAEAVEVNGRVLCKRS